MILQRTLLTTTLIFLMLFVFAWPGEAVAQEPTILLDGWQLTTDTAPVIIDGRTMVPFRAIAQRLGVQVEWDGPSQTVSAWGEDNYIALQITSKWADVNGEKVELDVPAQIINGRTLVPLRFFSEAFGAQVAWDGETRMVMVQSPPQSTYTLAFYAIRSFQQYQYLSRFNGAAFGWSRLDAQGALILDGRDFYWPLPAGEITPQALVSDMVGLGKDGLLMVYAGDGQGQLTELLAHPDRVERAVREITHLVEEAGFSGVMLDLEGLGMSDTGEDLLRVREEFNFLVKTLAENLGEGKKLAVALHPLNSAYKGYDYQYIGTYADQIVLMAYDYSPAREPEPLNLVEKGVQLALQEVPAAKLVLGINVWSEQPATLKEKVFLARHYDLAGIALWRLGLLSEEQWQALEEVIRW